MSHLDIINLYIIYNLMQSGCVPGCLGQTYSRVVACCVVVAAMVVMTLFFFVRKARPSRLSASVRRGCRRASGEAVGESVGERNPRVGGSCCYGTLTSCYRALT